MATGYDKNLKKVNMRYQEPNYKYDKDNTRYKQIYYLTTELDQNADQKFRAQLDNSDEEKIYLEALMKKKFISIQLEIL